MEQAMTWILVGTAMLGALVLALLNAWLLLKVVLSLLNRGSGLAGKVDPAPGNQRVRN